MSRHFNQRRIDLSKFIKINFARQPVCVCASTFNKVVIFIHYDLVHMLERLLLKFPQHLQLI